MITSSRRPCRLVLSASIAALIGSGIVGLPKAEGQVIKANNTDNLNLGSSWVGGVIPGVADIATWNATVVGPNSTILGADLTWSGIAITNPGGLVTIGGSNRLTLAGPTGIDLSAATQDLTINAPLTVNGAIQLGTRTLTLGGGNSVIAGTVAGTAPVDTIALNIAGGSLRLSGANTFTGRTAIRSGATVSLGNGSALGAVGVGHETVIDAGGTLNIGGQALGAEIVEIDGTGVGGIGALVNQGASNINALQFLRLAGNATVNAGGNLPASFNAAGTAIAGAVGRFDVRVGTYTPGAANLNLGGDTLTKIGAAQMALVNADVTQGNIVINEGTLSIEAGTVLQGAGKITVNQDGKLAYWGLTNNGVGAGWSVTVNGGTVGETLGSSASQTVVAPIVIAGALNPNFVSASNTTTMTGLISKDPTSTATELAKRGAQVLAFSNPANSFDIPVTIYQGTLRANFTTDIGAGGVPPDVALTSSDTPLGTNSTVKLAGGTLSLRINMANDGTLQRWALNKAIIVDNAPSAMDFDRLSNTGQTNKHVVINSLTFTAPSAANHYSIGQNQFTFTQGNTHRIEIPVMTMARDTVIVTGDHTFTGDILSAGKNSLVRSGGNTTQFINPGNHEFNAYFALGGTTRVGSGFGTPTTNTDVTVGTGPITLSPGAGISFRAPTNLAPGQTVNLVSQRQSMAAINLEQFVSVPNNLRAAGSGVIGVGSATGFGDLDLSRLGDGTFRVGSNISGSGNGVINGVISPGVGGVVRMGGSGTAGTGAVTVGGFNAITGDSILEVGSPLINGGFTTQIQGNNSGTVILAADNNYTGGTTVNRASILRLRENGAVGSGPISVFGTLVADGDFGTFINDAATANLPITLYGGHNLRFDSSALTTSTDVDRWLDTAPIPLLNGTLQLDARNNDSTTNETVGAITFAGGSTISLQRNNVGGNQIVQLQTPSITRVGTGTLEVNRSGSSGFGSTVKLLATTTPPLVTNGIIHPSITLIDATRLINFASYDPVTGFINASYTNTVTTANFPTGLTTGTDIVYVDFAAGVQTTTLGDNPVVYALKVGAGQNAATASTIATGAGTGITIRSGGLIISGDAATGNFSNAGGTQATINPSLTFNDGTANVEALVNVRGGINGILNGQIIANGLTKFGGGTLSITSSQTGLTGGASINGGILQTFGPQTTSAIHNALGTGIIRLAGGQLNVRPANIAGTAFSTSNNGSYTLQNGVTVAANIPIAVIDSNRAAADTTSTGTIAFNPATAGSSGLVLEGSDGTQGQTLTVSGANYGITFGTNAVNSFTGNVTINNAVNVQLNNSPAILGTNPVITKSGAGTLIVGAVATIAGTQVAPNATVVVNGGTLELRSLTAFGAGGIAGTSIVMNGGTLNLRRDVAGTYGGGSGAPYGVTVNGNVTISTDRNGTTGTNFAEGLGTLTINGSPTVTFNNGNGIYPQFHGSVDGASMKLNGLPFLASNVAAGSQDSAVRLDSPVVGGGFVKLGTGHVHLRGTNTYTGGTWVNQGIVRARAFESLGTGPVFLNPGGILDLASFDSIGIAQPVTIRSSGAFIPMLSVNTDFQHPLGANINATQAPAGILGLSNGTAGIYNSTIDLSAYYGGRWSLGGISAGAYDPVFTGQSIVAGLDALYRLGGGGTSFAMGTDDLRVARTNVLTGPNNVRLGFDSGNLFPVNQTNFQYSIAGTNDYSGGSTVIHRGMVARLFSFNDGVRSGLSNSNVDVFGILGFGGTGSLSTGVANTNLVTLHPGAGLVFDNANGAANNINAFIASTVTDRWNDTTPIALNGAFLNLNGFIDNVTSEAVGDVTYSRGARIRSGRSGTGTGTGTSTVTLANLLGAGPGNTLALQTTAAGTLGGQDQIIVTNNPPAVVNGMVSPSIINITDNTFVTYGGANGFANVAYDSVAVGNNATPVAIPAGLAATTKLDVTTGSVFLSDDLTVYALRTSQNINVGGPYSTVTLRGGGLIGTGGTIQPNLVFNDGTSNIEARIFVNGTLTINGTITANGITKFGHGAAGGAAGTLVINVPQPNYASGWTVNSGALQISNPQGLGQSVPSNGVTLNASLSTTGQVNSSAGGTNYAPTQLTLTYNAGTPELVTFTGGPVTVVNEGTVRIAAGDDRNLVGLPVTLTSTNALSRVGFTFDVPNNRFRGAIPSLTLTNDAVVRVTDSGSTTDTGRVTAGVVSQLIGTNRSLTKIGNRTLELPNDNSASFVGGSITVSQGTVRVRNNGSLGSATTGTTIERNATLEIDTDAFAPAGQLTQLPGSIERWNRETARPGTSYNLPAGVNLQLNTNLLATRTIGLNGGTIEGFHWIDHPAAAVLRKVGANVTVNLLADSFVGQNILQGQGYDAGRQPTVSGPFGDSVTGSFLQIDGNITGNFNLTKTGLDTVTLAGTGNTYANTIVELGVLRTGVPNTLPGAGVLTTRLNGTLDLYGNNQSVAGLGVPTAGPDPGGTSVGSSGRIINSAPTDNLLNVNTTGDFTYNGQIEQNVALTKSGAGTLRLNAASGYRGATTVAGGTLVVNAALSGTSAIDVQGGATLDVSGVVGGFPLGSKQLLKGDGNVKGAVFTSGTVAPGSNGVGTLTADALMTFGTGSTLQIELNSPSSFDRLVTNGISLDGTVLLSINLNFLPASLSQFTIVDNTSLDPVGGSTKFFSVAGPEGVLTEGEQFLVGPHVFSITYQGGSGNDVIISVPEPSSLAVLAGAVGLLGLRRRRHP